MALVGGAIGAEDDAYGNTGSEGPALNGEDDAYGSTGSEDSSTMGGGTVGGIVVGALLAIALVIVLGVLFLRRRADGGEVTRPADTAGAVARSDAMFTNPTYAATLGIGGIGGGVRASSTDKKSATYSDPALALSAAAAASSEQLAVYMDPAPAPGPGPAQRGSNAAVPVYSDPMCMGAGAANVSTANKICLCAISHAFSSSPTRRVMCST